MILIINGPSLNLLGIREPEVYGNTSMEDYLDALRADYRSTVIDYYQSNHEGDIIDRLHATIDEEECEGIILNAGAYSHTSLAIADAIRAINVPVIEVHISNIFAREPERARSVTAPACRGVIAGLGLDVYRLAVDALI